MDKKIEVWKKKLLDLGKRNRLLNYKETKRSNIKIVEPMLEQVFAKLVIEEKPLRFPHPINEEFDQDGDEIYELISEGDIKTDRDIIEQQKTLASLRSKARTAIQEQGINILYLSFGFLNWRESLNSNIYIKSPLVLVPVSLTIQSVTDPFVLELHEDEIVVNPTLLYKLENDFGIYLPSFDNYEEDIVGYLDAVNKIAKRNNWSVVQEMGLSLLSFLKINMYNDLEKNVDKIKSHPVLRGLAGDIDSVEPISDEYDNYDHDKKVKPIDMFQVVDADSSQQDAILYSKNNFSFILQGPPGTGKSQTITNIISEALADGKKVLFVSEKMAALEVVHKRLSQVGISEFCLTLHNHKAKKKDVLNNLSKTLNMDKVKLQEDSLFLLESLQDHKEKLNSYIKELHTKNMPLNKSIYEVNGLLAKLPKTKDIIFSIDNMDKISPEQLYKYKNILEELAKTIGKMKGDYKENPWIGCNVSNVSHELRHDIETNLGRIIPAVKELNNMEEIVNTELDLNIEWTINNILELIKLLDVIKRAHNIPVDWIYKSNIAPLLDKANKYMELLDEYKGICTDLSNYYNNNYFKIVSERTYKEIEILSSIIIQRMNNSFDEMDLVIDNFDMIINGLNTIIEKLNSAKESTSTIVKKYGFDEVENIKQLLKLNSILEDILKNPNPTEMWFDNTKEVVILNLFNEARKAYHQISKIEQDLLTEFDKDILSLDYVLILSRFRTEYNSIFKIFKKTYRTDKKTISSLRINLKSKLSDAKIVGILNKLKEIGDNKSWLKDNEQILNSAFGTHYLKEYTNWEELNNSFEVFKNIKNYLGNKIKSTNIKSLLLSEDETKEEIAINNNKIKEIQTYEILGTVGKLFNYEGNIDEINIKDIIDNSNILLTHIMNFREVYNNLREYSNEKYKYDKYINDLNRLKRAQEVDNLLKIHNEELKEEFLFLYKGINTDWNYIINSLMWATKFISLHKEYQFTDKLIRNVCTVQNYSNVVSEIQVELEKKIQLFKSEWTWFEKLFDTDVCLSDLELNDLIIRLESCLNGLVYLEEWIDFRSCRENCYREGLGEYLEKVEEANILKTQLVNAFLKRFYRLWLDAVIPNYPAVNSFRRRSQEDMIEEFKRLDITQLTIAQSRIKARLVEKLPDFNKATSARDEVGILKRELGKQRKIMPLRKLFKAIPNLLMSLKPCLMMSPLSVSLFLQSNSYDFDMVIFDEASQVCTEDAIGAIMRGKQTIIAGDNKQLPPTSFFGATVSDKDFDIDDEDDFDDSDGFESILDEALTVLPERTLKWHYRSRHEHLIAFSNAKIYNHSLVTFPSSFDKVPDNGVEYIYVPDGIYDRGGKKNNINEARKVAQLVFEHIKKSPNRSLGVVTFSGSQQQAVETAIRQLRLKNQRYEEFFNEDKEDAFFVKNLENVQGDERDTIIFSIGYAKDNNGIMYMNFGPLSRNGGFRRLNVAITRAKYNVKLVGSIHPTDIDINRTNSEGVIMLRSYIEFAINGESVLQNELTYNNNVDIESPFEGSVYNFLTDNGFSVATQVGCSGYRIDLAVKHPTLSGRFVLGIECDGAMYHSARTARERDRIRQTVLEDIGWKIYRIWSTDWVKDPKTEGDKLLVYIKKCIDEYSEDALTLNSKVNGNNDTIFTSEDFLATEEITNENVKDTENPYGFKYYMESDIYDVERYANDRKYVAELVKHVVKSEAPIHFELLCKRLAPVFGRQKATSFVRNWITSINDLIRDQVTIKESFYWWKTDTNVKVRIPLQDETPRTISYICIEEIAEAMFVIAKNSIGITKENLVLLTAREFGFNRAGKNITNAMKKATEYLLTHDKVKIVEEKVIII